MNKTDFAQRMAEFHTAHRGVMQADIVRRAHVPSMLAAAAAGNLDYLTVLLSIQAWIDDVGRRNKRKRSLCLSCDATFHARNMPDAFLVVTPFAATGHAIVTGICRRCARQDDAALSIAALNNLRTIYPDLTLCEPARA
jgi:hypothetical protein